MIDTIKTEWFSNVKGDILSGVVVAMALIPEAIAFSIIAGVDPMVGLYASFLIAVIISFAGGRPAMISAATGAMALVAAPLVADYGVHYLLAATILTGVFQLLFGVFKVAKLMKFIPRAVMIGFVNSLAILIFMAQVPHFLGISSMTYVFVGITLGIVYILPRFFNAVPAPLIAIVLLTIVAVYSNYDLRTVGDLGTITQSLPSFFIPDVPFTIETLMIILPYALALSVVGLLESLLTATIVDDMTDTGSNKNREARGQGIANFVTGFFGGMAGCAMIGQSVINVKSGGLTRLSTFIAGAFLMFLILVLGSVVVQIPMAVLVGIMIMVSIGTFDWSSFSYMTKAPKSDTAVMLVTVIIVVVTHDLSQGVIAGVILSAVLFVSKISKIQVKKTIENSVTRYAIDGQLFFASVEDFLDAFELDVQHKKVVLDFTDAHIWDDSGVGAVDRIVLKLRENDNEVIIEGLDGGSRKLVEKIAVFNSKNAKLPSH
ncbi:SulP family inorganic anion transporter [Planococcus lenghuensis]|uniref:Sulfate permease n=1 Tax=Planococcus lenghuensis TaxID=2213202 RepID=A0A1Q2L247_9BACL|nr:SulP family inorganic anion transporter [Planococcus lenghuensis]AQQ54545.1 sulfate permease [Planococcus lenghuensis]